MYLFTKPKGRVKYQKPWYFTRPFVWTLCVRRTNNLETCRGARNPCGIGNTAFRATPAIYNTNLETKVTISLPGPTIRSGFLAFPFSYRLLAPAALASRKKDELSKGIAFAQLILFPKRTARGLRNC